MAHQTATEKDMFVQTFEREVQTTLKLLRAFPADRADFKPHERSTTALNLAWTFGIEQTFAASAADGELAFGKMGSPPATLPEAIAVFESAARGTVKKITETPEEALNQTMQLPVAPGKMGELRRFDVVWQTLMDQVHHRGQLSVYLRLVGAKVPSIYGPTADEPWTM